jgi:glycosyltransferase involved in cell wall biosynthesis
MMARGSAEAGGASPRVLHLVQNVSVPSDVRVWPETVTLEREGWDVAVISPKGAGKDDDDLEERAGVEIHRYAPRPGSGGLAGYAVEYAWALWHTARLVRRLSRRHHFAVVHAANPPDLLLLAAWPLKRRGTALIFDQHDLVPEFFAARFGGRHRWGGLVARLVERVAYALADVVVSPNESYRDVALRRGGKRPEDVFVVRNGPDLDRFRPVPPAPGLKRDRPHLVAYVGEMGHEDGVDHAVRALAHLRTRRDDWRAVFVGEGDQKREVERLVRELGLADVTEFTGYIPQRDLPPILAAADVCLAPEPKTPLNDASTLVKIAEYMSMGRPVVGYDLRESRHTADGAAVYARPNDHVDFARCIDQLLDDPALRESMGARGRRRVEEALAWQHSAATLLRAYERATALGASRRRDRRPGFPAALAQRNR